MIGTSAAAVRSDEITSSYDDDIATVVCERDILDGQPIIFYKWYKIISPCHPVIDTMQKQCSAYSVAAI